MKRLLPVFAAVTFILVGCGGGSDGEATPLLPADDQDFPIAPGLDIPVENDSNVAPGALSDLFGRAVFAYGFYDTEPVFLVDVTFTPESVVESSGIAVLVGLGSTGAMLNTGGSIVQARDMTVGCSFVDEGNLFLCVLDASGANESLFVFDRPMNGTASGSFEFCNQRGITDCVDEVLQTPDGVVALVISEPLTKLDASTKLASETNSEELLPYLQYLEQGTASMDGNGIAPFADERVDAMINTATSIQKLATE